MVQRHSSMLTTTLTTTLTTLSEQLIHLCSFLAKTHGHQGFNIWHSMILQISDPAITSNESFIPSVNLAIYYKACPSPHYSSSCNGLKPSPLLLPQTSRQFVFVASSLV
jgi:hypothetical protein